MDALHSKDGLKCNLCPDFSECRPSKSKQETKIIFCSQKKRRKKSKIWLNAILPHEPLYPDMNSWSSPFQAGENDGVLEENDRLDDKIWTWQQVNQLL